MRLKSFFRLLPGVLIPVIFSLNAIAGEGHSEEHANEGMSMAPAKGMHMDEEEEHNKGDEDHESGGDHAHSNWVAPPSKYASLRYGSWGSADAARRGKTTFTRQCIVCHGADGKGTGPAAAALEHPPANLTNNFHRLGGDGDAYLFWRVTEGGTAEPFKSMKSAMPAFGAVLTPQQRWDVLTYVHRDFHHGFKDEEK